MFRNVSIGSSWEMCILANLRKVNFTIMNNIMTKMFYIKLFQWNLQSVAESMTGTAAEEVIMYSWTRRSRPSLLGRAASQNLMLNLIQHLILLWDQCGRGTVFGIWSCISKSFVLVYFTHTGQCIHTFKSIVQLECIDCFKVFCISKAWR